MRPAFALRGGKARTLMRRPVFVAEQARSAHGLLGRLVAFVMARETWAENNRAIVALAVRPGDQILDIGCGPGRSIAALAELALERCVVGVDPSELMAGVALRRNRALISSCRAKIAIASASSLPFGDATFDSALCVHVLYFWADLAAALKEIARVLKPGGRLALVFRTNADEKAVSAFPAEVYRFPAMADVLAPLEAAGLAVTRIDDLRSDTAPVLLLVTKGTGPASCEKGPNEQVSDSVSHSAQR
jgi:SAM-dependent methyltransferase